MTKPRLWITVAAGSALAIALTTAALGADVTDLNNDSAGPAVANVSLPDKASSVATAVLGALTGGSNPSTAASNGNSKAGEQANHDSDEDNDTDEAANEDENENESGHEAGPAGTTGTKPGWGCGDTNHTHSGPPGNPGATRPCDKH
jgi:hypothetical protein